MSERTQVNEAARWFLRLQEKGADAQAFLAWQRWINAAPAHRIAYDEIEETILQLRIPVTPRLPSAREMMQDDYDGSMSIEDWKRREQMPKRSTVRYALAAGVALAIVTGGYLFHAKYRAQHGVFTYETVAGERREFKLPEGSRVTLDAESALHIELTPQRRSLRLAHGEAYFEVVKDVQRPFTVQAGETLVRALGTAFNVRMTQDRTVIAVTEGKVEVTAEPVRKPSTDTPEALPAGKPFKRPIAAQLSAGEAVSYIDAGQLAALPQAEATLATSWLKGRRQYRNEPLRYVLADVDRYTGRRIEIADSATGDLQFTGTLDLENSDAWLKALALALPVVIVETQEGGLAVSLNSGTIR